MSIPRNRANRLRMADEHVRRELVEWLYAILTLFVWWLLLVVVF